MFFVFRPPNKKNLMTRSDSSFVVRSAEVIQAHINITRVGAALVGRVTDLSGEIDVEFQMCVSCPSRRPKSHPNSTILIF
jgi:hypothetical protein